MMMEMEKEPLHSRTSSIAFLLDGNKNNILVDRNKILPKKPQVVQGKVPEGQKHVKTNPIETLISEYSQGEKTEAAIGQLKKASKISSAQVSSRRA